MAQMRVPASDEDRERAVAELEEHYADGRLGEDELARRVTLVHRAGAVGEVRAALRDLPRLRRGRPDPWELVRDPRRHAGLFLAGGALLAGIALTAHVAWPWPILGAWAAGLALQALARRAA